MKKLLSILATFFLGQAFATPIAIQQPSNKIAFDSRVCIKNLLVNLNQQISDLAPQEFYINDKDASYNLRSTDGQKDMNLSIRLPSLAVKTLTISVNDHQLFKDNPYISKNHTLLTIAGMPGFSINDEVPLVVKRDDLGNIVESYIVSTGEVIKMGKTQFYNIGFQIKNLIFPTEEYTACLNSALEKNQTVSKDKIELVGKKIYITLEENCNTPNMVFTNVLGSHLKFNGDYFDKKVFPASILRGDKAFKVVLKNNQERSHAFLAVKSCGKESRVLDIPVEIGSSAKLKIYLKD